MALRGRTSGSSLSHFGVKPKNRKDGEGEKETYSSTKTCQKKSQGRKAKKVYVDFQEWKAG